MFSIRVVYYTQSTLDTNCYVSVPDTFYAKSSIRTPDDFNTFPDLFSVIYLKFSVLCRLVADACACTYIDIYAETLELGSSELRVRAPSF